MKIKVTRIEPLADRIIVKADPIDENESGLTIPENAKEKPQTGTVISSGVGAKATIMGDPQAKQDVINKIGSLAWSLLTYIFERLAIIPNELKAGDKILFGKYAGQVIEVDGQDYLVMRESDVIGRILPE